MKEDFDIIAWDTLKQEGSKHYKTGVEPIDLLKAGNMLHDKACGDIIKYAFRSRREIDISKEKLIENMNKIIHYAQLLKTSYKEKE